MPPPPCRPSSTLQALIEELVEEILTRIPPDEPADLLRAALVCKPWRPIISDPGFLRRYRAFHRRRPPLLGFFCNDWAPREQVGYLRCFNPAAAAFPSLALSLPMRYCHGGWCVLDSRHGRVLLRDRPSKNLMVWDLISDACQELQLHDIDQESYCFVVLCAVAGCDHHDCCGGPFLVVYLGADVYLGIDEYLGAEITDSTAIVTVLVYSSEARAWSAPIQSQFDDRCNRNIDCDFNIIYGRAAVVGDKIYCLIRPGADIVQYDLVKHCISLLVSSEFICSEASHNWPAIIVGEDLVLTQNEDGSLGLASIRDSRLYLWSSRTVNHDGELVAEWVQERVIQLHNIVPIDMDKHSAQIYVSGFAEGVGILSICTNVGTFTLELKSGRVRKITASKDFRAFPFISFFSPSTALIKLYVDSPHIKGHCSSS